MASNTSYRILLAGGGTAGHVEPAIAVGKWIKANHPEVECEFIGTKSGLEAELVPGAGFQISYIDKAPFPRKLALSSIKWPFTFVNSLRQTGKALSGMDMVVGFGGYVSAPVYLMAKLSRIPIVIHEANAYPGWANRLGARLGGSLLISFENSRKYGKAWRAAKLTGVPLRSQIIEAASMDESARQEVRARKAVAWGLNPEKPIVIVFGGSQGSQYINKVIDDALPLILRSGIQLVHAVGKNNPIPSDKSGYKPIGYFADLPEAYVAADLVISRSGAVTCHELDAIGTYALLVPLSVGNGEQKLNGEELVAAGAAMMISNNEFTSRWLEENMVRLLTSAKKYSETQSQTKRVPLYPMDAAKQIGNTILSTLREEK